MMFPDRLSSGKAAQQTSLTQEPTATDKSYERQASGSPQQSLEETLSALIGVILDNVSVNHRLRPANLPRIQIDQRSRW